MEQTVAAPAVPTSAVPAAKASTSTGDDLKGGRGFPPTTPAEGAQNSAKTASVTASGADESQCELRFLMVNGESFRMVVPASSSVQEVKQKVIDERPTELVHFLKNSKPSILSGPSKVDEIRILHLGKFLEDTKSLKECNFATGSENLTTVHISVRVPASASEDVKEKVNKKGSACCAVM